LLHGVQFAVLGQPFNSRYFSTVGLDRQAGTGFDRHSVHMNGAGTALAGITPNIGSGQGKVVSQKVDQ
jgi:hypothetical protein